MPVNLSLAKALIKKYGKKRGKQVYYAMENEKKKGFQKGLRTAIKEGHIVSKFPKKRKKSKR